MKNKVLKIMSIMYIVIFIGYFLFCWFVGTAGFFGEQPTILDGLFFAIEWYWSGFKYSFFIYPLLFILTIIYLCKRGNNATNRNSKT